MFLGPLLERDSKVIMFNVFVYVLLTFFSIANSVNLFFASKKEEFFIFFSFFPFSDKKRSLYHVMDVFSSVGEECFFKMATMATKGLGLEG